MKTVFRFHVTIPGSDSAITWIGGGLKLSKRPGYVWLTKPGGEPLMEVPRERVRPISFDEMVQLVKEDIQWRKAETN